jgi:hypothetical protein
MTTTIDLKHLWSIWDSRSSLEICIISEVQMMVLW